MIYYILLPFFAVALIVLQTTLAEVIFSQYLAVEISLIVVIYAGFRLQLVRGALLAFVLGFVYDCLAGSALGLFALIYVLIFLMSFFVSGKMDTEKTHFIALFTLLCAFLEEFMLILFYNLAYGFDIFNNLQPALLPQALIVSLLAPAFFYIMRQVEDFFDGQKAQSAKRPRTGRISAET